VNSIRAEREGDAESIAAVTRDAFASAAHASGTEAAIVSALREAGALTLSLVAERDGGIVGHIAFSPVRIADGTRWWYGLGPVSVLPSLQGKGIGSDLVQRGLAALQERGAAGCVLVGEPAFYGRFGFRQQPGLTYPGLPAEYFLARSFNGKVPSGSVAYHAAFEATA
jgi:putative acetyltransferase